MSVVPLTHPFLGMSSIFPPEGKPNVPEGQPLSMSLSTAWLLLTMRSQHGWGDRREAQVTGSRAPNSLDPREFESHSESSRDPGDKPVSKAFYQMEMEGLELRP